MNHTSRRRRLSSAFSLIEVLMAAAIGAIALAAAFLVDSQQMRLVKTTRESGAASTVLQERVEQLRIATWRQVTDPAYLSNKYFATVPKSIAPLDEYSEQVQVTTWPDAAVSTPLVVIKRKNAASEVVSSGQGIADQRLAKVDVRISWRGQNGRDRVRELSTVISNGGISRMNLPSMGNAAGVPPLAGSSTPPPAATPSPGSTATPAPISTPAASPGGSTPAPVPVISTPTPKKAGRGNVSGKAGKA